MPRILLLTGNASAADRERYRGFVEFLQRRARLSGDAPGDTPEETAADPGSAAAALLALAGRGRLSYAAADGGVDVLYTPSREALRSVFESAPGTGFPEPVHKKQTAAFRTSQGAIFRFPLEKGPETGPDTRETALEVFITEWTPFPSACAVAIHRSHPFAKEVDKREGDAFTGRYVRHPLTGDLLPVWVADWVRPDFGTGAVVVNPAHSAVDLAFARQVGLPIRFALVPAGYDGSPATWPQPPIVKSGQSVRTGFWDGLPAAEAADRYFEVLSGRGLAERHRDLQAGRWTIGRLVPPKVEAESDLAWNGARAAVLPADVAPMGGRGVCVEASDLLAAALACGVGAAGEDTGGSSRPVLVAPAGEPAGDLLALRLLAIDLTGQPLEPAAVHLVQKVQESKVEAPAEAVRLAVLVGAPVQQVAVVKQQTLEQVQRFLRVHQELLESFEGAPEAGGSGAAENPAARALAKIKEAVGEADPAKAFALLQQTQKQLRDMAPEKRGAALPGYFALAEAVAGLAAPSHLDASQVWGQIG